MYATGKNNPLAMILISLFIALLSACTPTLPNKKCVLTINNKTYPCGIGKRGIRKNKQEGDGATPAGIFPLRKIIYRPDRISRQEIKTSLPVEAMSPDDGWNDDPSSPDYNRLIQLPSTSEHEKLWRDDHFYDLIIVVGYNDSPIIKGKGSAIFLHIAPSGYLSRGCITFSKQDLLEIISQLTPQSSIEVLSAGKITIKK